MGNLTVKESGEMINFISPNVSNITSFKVHFSPRQEGTGDPSPENVREIMGWNGVEGYISNVAQSYSLPSNTLTTSIDWTEDVGTVYGGYVDLISGELVQTIKRVEFTWGDCEDATVLGNTERRYIVFNDNRFKTMNNLETKVSNIFSTFLGNTSWNVDEVSCVFGNNTIICKLPVGSDNNTIIQIAGDLATPITHQLTPQQLSTLKGQNNFWSNADYVEIEYELTETFDIQKAKRKIILNQPHVESASGDLITFDTDMKGKLKECKVYFSPVQEGEGDPSPDNVRNIVGWNGANIYRHGINFAITDTMYCGKLRPSEGIIKTANAYKAWCIPIPKGIIRCSKIKKPEYGNIQMIAMVDDIPQIGMPFYGVDGIEGSNTNFLNYSSRLVDNTTGHKYLAIFASQIFETFDEVINVTNFMITLSSIEIDTTTNYIEPSADYKYSIDWTNDVGTVYGGYVDLVSGELVATHLAFVMDGVNHKVSTGAAVNTNNNMARGHAFMGRTGGLENLPLGKNNTGLYAINKYVIHGMENGAGNTAVEGVYCGTGTPYIRVVVSVDDLADVSGANAILNSINEWLTNNPVQICYTLADPIHYQLTPQQILALKGTNNVYSDTNGQTEIKYWKH